MKIAIDARTMGSRPSGIGMYLYDFLKQLCKCPDYEFILISDVAESEYIKEFMDKGIKVCTLGEKIYRSVQVYKYFKFVKRMLKEIEPDIFWEVNTIIPVKLNGNFKTMITIHDMFPIEYVEYFGKVYSMYFRLNLKKTLKNTDMILYNSLQTKLSTEKFFPEAEKIANCNAYIISNPLTKTYEIKDGDFFLYVGNMEKRKGVDLLLKGYKRYRELGGDKPLLLAGKMQEDDIKALLEKTQACTEGITYLDYVSNKKKHELFATCGCFVFPSKAEGFGMPVLEVMKFNKPIVVGNLDIFDEIVGDCINRFNIQTDEAGQINNLAEKMLDYNKEVDVLKYRAAVLKYSPEKLGKIVVDFISESVKK